MSLATAPEALSFFFCDASHVKNVPLQSANLVIVSDLVGKVRSLVIFSNVNHTSNEPTAQEAMHVLFRFPRHIRHERGL